MLWLLGLLWPLLGIHPDGTLTFQKTITVWCYILAGSFVCLMIYVLKTSGSIKFVADPVSRIAASIRTSSTAMHLGLDCRNSGICIDLSAVCRPLWH